MFLLMACFLAACQSSPKEVDAQDDGTLPTDFIEFYDKYHADSAFQLEHTLFPLPYLGQKKNIQEWTADNWVLHQPIDIKASELFDRSFYRIGRSIIGEEIISPSLNLKIERRWQETQGKWLLIYYQPLD
jgi:hypothetical protein